MFLSRCRGHVVARVACLIIAAAVLLTVATVVDPYRTSAIENQRHIYPPPHETHPATRSDPADSRRALGELFCNDYRVLIHASEDGPLYTVYSADGHLMAEDLHADEVYRMFPDLPIHEMFLDPDGDGRASPGPIMMVNPD